MAIELPGTKPTGTARGLSEADARARLGDDGYNELPRPDRRTPLRIISEVLREPMLALLLGGGAIYLLIGSLQDALVLLAFAMLSVLITVVQESRTERVLEALRDLTSPRALVIRDGQRRRIAGREVVRGDLLVLAEGDRVPADAALRESHDLQADESLLTGESVPVRKIASSAALPPIARRPGGDDLPNVFSGSLIVRGSGIGEVLATGTRSEIGRIGLSLSLLETEPSRLKVQTQRLVRVFALAGGSVSVVAVLLYGTLRGGWLDALLAGIALGMSMLPEEFPVVLTVFMAMGAWRISQARVLTRRAAAIEALGSATVLCTDKTGTLTENRMSIAEVRLPGGDVFTLGGASPRQMPQRFRSVLEDGVLASAQVPVDPMEKAFHELAREQLAEGQGLPGTGWKLVHAYGLRPDLLAMSNAWQPGDGGHHLVVASKGAPEAIFGLCHRNDADRAVLTLAVDTMAAAGLRVLGVARATLPGLVAPASHADIAFELIGLVGMADPLRASVPAAVAECRTAGIRVLMITGDYPATAMAIAGQAGLAAGDLVSGAELAQLDDARLAERVRTANVFARILPEQKLRIVEALKRGGEIVAMTGDGVNDAPSLKAAHIGIAMGGRGTDVAREAAAIVLLDDDFGSIVTSVRLGRRIYDNLRKAMGFIFSVHVPIAGLALLPLLTGLPILFSPIHIAFLEMVIDPVSSLVFEAETEEDDVMGRPPRSPAEPLFSRALIGWSVTQGAVALLVVALVFVGALELGMAAERARALTFVCLVLSFVSLVLVNRSFSTSLWAAVRRPNPALAWVLLVIATLLAVALVSPWARALFRFGPLHAGELAVALAVGVVVLVVLEAMKPRWSLARKAIA